MTIYGRKAVYRDFVAQSKDIFEDCNAAIEFYEKFFQTRFPFSKLDTIFILEFNYGAMENVGAVVYSEDYCLIKGDADIIKRTEINETFLHEIAHMWFGNLVVLLLLHFLHSLFKGSRQWTGGMGSSSTNHSRRSCPKSARPLTP